jgi:hypothetical protein
MGRLSFEDTRSGFSEEIGRVAFRHLHEPNEKASDEEHPGDRAGEMGAWRRRRPRIAWGHAGGDEAVVKVWVDGPLAPMDDRQQVRLVELFQGARIGPR